jgi:hypothetical protein
MIKIMNKEEHINWWIEEANRNWQTDLFDTDGKQNVFSYLPFIYV